MEKDGFSVQLQRVVKTQGVVLAIVKCSKNLGFLPAYMEHIKGGAKKLTKLAPHFLHNLSSYCSELDQTESRTKMLQMKFLSDMLSE